MCQICAARSADFAAGLDTHQTSGGTQGAANAGQLQQIARYLTDGYWASSTGYAGWSRSFDMSADKILTYHFYKMPKELHAVAEAALDAWSDATGIVFLEINGGTEDIFFRGDDRSGAYSVSSLSSEWEDIDVSQGDQILRSQINIPRNWDDDPVSLNSYWFQTFLHEIGHALGLGHAGNYNGEATWANGDWTFRADSWQASVMSYFPQWETPRDDGDFAYLATVMPADILAIQQLYGLNPTTRAGDTTYGANSNVGGYLGRMFAAHYDFKKAGGFVDIDNPLAFTVYDTGGIDTLDFSTLGSNARINLNIYAASDVGGIRGSVVIGPDTVIENAIGGRGRDLIIGNGADNGLSGRGANDQLRGRRGDDTLEGGQGDDRLDGGDGQDVARFRSGSDLRVDLGRSDAQGTGQGRDRLVSIEHARTGSGDDRLSGNAAANRLDAGAGRDRLSGGAGDDTLFGGTGNDSLAGGTGKDRLLGQAGDDTLTGGAGSDTFVFAAGHDRATDFRPGEDRLAFVATLWGGIERTASEIVEAFADATGAGVTFSFGGGNRLTLAGLADTTGLDALIDII